jgi:hypothetical protein
MSIKLMCGAMVIALALGCSQKNGFDTLPPGSLVTVTQQDGSTVTGRLVEVSPDEVVVDPPDKGRRVMRRDGVSSIAVTDVALAPDADRSATEPSDDVTLARAQWTEITLPAGAVLQATLETAVGSDVSKVETPVTARVANDVEIDGQTVIPAGAELSGSIVDVSRPGKVSGRAAVAFRFDRLIAGNSAYDIRTETVSRRARNSTKEDALKIGLPAVGGAIVGGIIGGGKGAAIGGATGAGAGTAVVMTTRGDNVHLPAGTAVRVEIVEPLRMRVRI